MTRQYEKVGLIIAAAGNSSRCGNTNKLLEDLDGQPVFLHAMQRFWQTIPPDRTVLVAADKDADTMRAALRKAGCARLPRIVYGGSTRAESVLRGLYALPPGLPLVAIQDAARPLTPLTLLHDCIDAAAVHGSGVAARRVTDTIKRATPDQIVQQTLDRCLLWAAETPQVLRTECLRTAYEAALNNPHTVLTDDASAVEAMGQAVHLVESTAPNPKITFLSDLEQARTWLQSHARR